MTTLTLLTPVSVTATGGGIDLALGRLTGQARVTLMALNTAGTSPTLACKLQTSTGLARGYEFSTVGTTGNELREGASTNIELAAAFTQSGARSIKRVALYLDKEGTLAAGKKLTLTIETDNTGNPSGTAVTNGTSATVDIDTEVSATAGWIVFTFAKPVDLADATVYHLVLSGDYSASGTNNVRWYSTTVASGGTLNKSADGTTFAGVIATESAMVYVDQYTFADLTSGGFTSLATAGTASVQTLGFHARNLPAVMRLYSTIGGTSNPAWTVGAAVNSARVQEQ
jgi:hypothetical protein